MTDIQSRIAAIREEIAKTCQLANRDPDTVNLLAVSKTMGVDAVPEAIWHFVGAIQSNKTRDIANRFAWVHGIASEKVAKRLSEQREPALGRLNCLIQVNLSGEDQKSGVDPDEAVRLVGKIAAFDQISLRGLMTIPAPTNDHSAQAATFSTLRELKDDIESRYGLPEFNQLSMGMTNDFVEAIKEGATWIRIGTAIFGPRNVPPAPSTSTRKG
jgi:PLP dependent protein